MSSEQELRSAVYRLLQINAEAEGVGFLDCVDNQGGHYQSAGLERCLHELSSIIGVVPPHPNSPRNGVRTFGGIDV